MKKDRFWKYFLAIFVLIVLSGIGTTYGILRYVAPKNLPAIVLPQNTGAVAHAQIPLTATTTEFFFHDSVPFGYDKWSWGATVNWRTDSHYYEGAHALGIAFNEPWSGIEIAGPGTITTGYRGIALATYVESGIDELYVEIYRKDGSLIGRQPLDWYAPGRTLRPGMWQNIVIPLENFSGSFPAMIGRVSIIGKAVGRAYFDSIRLVRSVQAQAPWTPPVYVPERDNSTPPIADLLQQTASASLPYALEFTPLAAGMWYSMTGTFRFAPTEALLGLPDTGTASTVLFLGGKSWSNYRVNTTLNWGAPSTFSILARFTDENNFTSCSFSSYGMYVQLYHTHKGEWTFIGETPELAIPQLDAWSNVQPSMEVIGNRVTCILNGEKVLSASIPTLPQAGTMGLEAWSRESGGVPHRLQTVTVTPL